MPNRDTTYDAIIIGMGQAGRPLAAECARHGWRTAIVERSDPGGACINTACTPTKTMIASARVAHLARRSADFGVQSEGIEIDMAAIRQRKRDVVNRFRKSAAPQSGPKLDVFLGTACFVGPRRIHIEARDGGDFEIKAKRIFINTGTRPLKPRIAGLPGMPLFTPAKLMDLDVLPAQLIILGGGSVGCEFAQMYRRFGSDVTIVEAGNQLLSNEDSDIAAEVKRILVAEGVSVRLESMPIYAEPSVSGLRLTVRCGENDETLEGTHVLAATGRVPNTADLHLAAAGVETDEQGFVLVNSQLETTAPGVYALGDVNGGPEFTHVAYDDFRVIRDNLMLNRQTTKAGRLIPYTVFTDPELGRVGLTEKAATEAGYAHRVAKLPLTEVARAVETGETAGLLKAVVHADTSEILGVSFLSPRGGELAAIVQIAMLAKLPFQALAEAVFAHPTFAEPLNTLFQPLEKRSTVSA